MEMSKKEALEILEQVSGMVSATREVHAKIMHAVQVLKNAIKEEK